MKELNSYDPRIKKVNHSGTSILSPPASRLFSHQTHALYTAMMRKIHLQEEERRLEILAKMSTSNKNQLSLFEKSTAVLEAIKEDLIDAFNLFDTEQNGLIKKKNVGTVLKSAGLIPTEKSLHNALASIKPGPVDMSTVFLIARKFAMDSTTKEDLISAFKEVFDKSDSGYVNPKEIMEAAKNVGHSDFTDVEMQMLMEFCGVKDVSEKDGEESAPVTRIDASRVVEMLWNK